MALIDMDVKCELASAIVERQWDKEHDTPHSYTAKNGDIRYIEEVQDEFNEVLDLIDEVLTPEPFACLHNFDGDDDLAICKTCGVIRATINVGY